MTMLSFRVDERDASDAQRWAEALGIDRSELLREALRRHLDRLASEGDGDRWEASPLQPGETSPRPTSPIGDRQRTGRSGLMQRGEVWFAATPGGDRPVLVLTRDPVADRIGSVVVAALTRTRRGLASELELTEADGVPDEQRRQLRQHPHDQAGDLPASGRHVSRRPEWPMRVAPSRPRRAADRRSTTSPGQLARPERSATGGAGGRALRAARTDAGRGWRPTTG